jgi:hypothetical protein
MKQKMLPDDYISPEDLEVFTVQDDPDEAVRIIVEFKEGKGRAGIAMPPGVTKGQSRSHEPKLDAGNPKS